MACMNAGIPTMRDGRCSFVWREASRDLSFASFFRHSVDQAERLKGARTRDVEA
jgi:hypothetical protein